MGGWGGGRKGQPISATPRRFRGRAGFLLAVRAGWRRWRCASFPAHASPAHLHVGIHHLCWHTATPPADETDSGYFCAGFISPCASGSCFAAHTHASSRKRKKKSLLVYSESRGVGSDWWASQHLLADVSVRGSAVGEQICTNVVSILQKQISSSANTIGNESSLSLSLLLCPQVERGHAVWLFNNQRKEGLQQPFRRDRQI